MYKIRAKNLKASALTSRQERQLEVELKFADQKREFPSKAAAETFAANLPGALSECVEVVETK